MHKILEDNYSDETYTELEEQAKYILSYIDDSQDDLEKLLTIYTILGSSIYYDKYWDERGNIRPSIWQGNQTLEGALLEGITVCAGFSKTLCYLLNKLGIECKYIIGEVDQELHAWNYVKINGSWYNCDLTWDSDNIKKAEKLDFCLKGKNHSDFSSRRLSKDYSNIEISNYDFNPEKLDIIQKKVKKMLQDKDFKPRFPRLKEREERIFLCKKGATKQEIINYKIARGSSKDDAERETIWEKFEASRIKRKYELRKQAKKVDIPKNLSDIVEYIMHCRERGIMVYVEFKGHRLYSTDYDFYPDLAFMQIIGMTKTSHLKYINKLSVASTEEEKKDVYREIKEEKEKTHKLLQERKKEERNLLLKYYPEIVEHNTEIELK